MEFHEKLQELRKRKGLTQEELARALWVSRAAVSKWESGRGYPSIDSLKQIAKFYAVTIDELLSGDQLLTIAEADRAHKENRYRDLVFGLLDISTVLFFFLPLFGQHTGGSVQAVSLPALTTLSPLLRVAYSLAVTGIVLFGILTLALQSVQHPLWLRSKHKVSLLLCCLATLLFILSPQPYAAALLFVFLLIKALILVKKP